MTFTMSAPAAPRPRTRRQKIPLAPVDKTYLLSRGGRRQCWAATTKDKEWDFTREEDGTTSWTVKHRPTGIVVDTCIGTLIDCQAYVASGQAQRDLKAALGIASEEGKGNG
jgi:hypothetical protein